MHGQRLLITLAFVLLLFTRETSGLIGATEVIIYGRADVLFLQRYELLQVEGVRNSTCRR